MGDEPYGIREGEIAVALPDKFDASLYFIGRIHTPWQRRQDCPKNGRESEAVCTIEVDARWVQALSGVESCSHLVVLYWMHQARRDLVVQAPRHYDEPRGSFALRSPVRPNPVAMSVVRLLKVEGNKLSVTGLDCLDGTALVDIKPYFASTDAAADAVVGWHKARAKRSTRRRVNKEKSMRIAAMAAGAVGGYFGARMAAAGHDVFFIARGANLEAIKKNGLKIESVHGDVHLPKPNVTDDPAKVGPVDIVLFAVKLWDTEKAAEFARQLVGPDTRLITLQNGVDSVERIAPILGAEQTIGGAAYIATTIAAPGVIKHTSSFASMRFGRVDKRADAKLQAFVDAGKAAKIDVDIPADIERERWQKFIFLTAMAGSTATLRSSIGVIRADPETLGFFRKLMEEAFAVGRAKGISLDPTYIEERMGFVLNKVEPGMKASMAHDLERGNRLELDWLNGKVRELGRALNVPTPASDTVFTVLKLHRMGSA